MRTCIVTGEYYKRHETMVNYHIEHLFGGDTCVLYSKDVGASPLDRASLNRRISDRSLLGNLSHLAQSAAMSLRHSTVRVPSRDERKWIKRFFAEQKVEAGLSEFGTQTVAVAPVFAEAGVPLFGYFRGFDASRIIQVRRKARAYQKMMSNLAGIVGVSQFLLDNLASKGIVHPNAHVIPSGVDVRRFIPGQKIPNRFLTVGRFVEKKLPKLTLRAFAEATANHPDAVLEMIGDGPLLEPCKSLAAELGIADRVIFHGAQPHSFVQERLAVSQFFLQHSVTAPDGNTEGLPIAIQEAMASGAVVLSTRHAGIPEAVEEGHTGLLVDEHDAKGFAQGIVRLLSEELDIAAMTALARKRAVEKFDNQVLIKRLETVMLETVRSRQAVGPT
ncbi:MAG: glycosyltransferase [Pseudomonadota bacterium]